MVRLKLEESDQAQHMKLAKFRHGAGGACPFSVGGLKLPG